MRHPCLSRVCSALLLPVGGVGTLVACAPEASTTVPRVVSEIAPVAPTGTVAGRVVDATSGDGLVDVDVILPQVPGAKTSTDEAGYFRFEAVPASTGVNIMYAREGFAPAYDSVDLPAAAGNLAQVNGVAFSGPIALFPLVDNAQDGWTTEIALRDPEGASVTGNVSATLSVSWLDAGMPSGGLTVEAVDGTQSGNYVLLGLPDIGLLASIIPSAEVRVVALPDNPAWNPAIITQSVAALAAERLQVVTLTPATVDPATPVSYLPDTPLEVLATNVGDLQGDAPTRIPSVVNPGDTIQLAFNRPVDPETFFISLVDGDGVVHVSDASIMQGDFMTLPVPASFAGRGGEVIFEAFASDASADVNPLRRRGFFLTSPPGDAIAFEPWNVTDAPHFLQGINAAGTLLCPSVNGELRIKLNGRVGGRHDSGAGASSPQFLPIRVTSVGAVPGTALDPDAGIPVLARWVSDGIVGESGYSTTLIVPWPGVTNATIVEDTFDYSLRLQFNDVSMASSPRTQVVIRGPGGSPVDVVEGTVRVLIAQGCI